MSKPVNVVVAYDFTPTSHVALERAIELVLRAPQHALHIIAAVDQRGLAIDGHAEASTYETTDKLRAIVIDHVTEVFAGRTALAEVQVFVHIRIGKAATEILALASEIGADLIMIGSHGKTGLERLVLGSVSERVVRDAGCPVMVARAKTYADVELVKVIPFEHARAPHREPHCYTYVNRQVVMRPNDWPIS